MSETGEGDSGSGPRRDPRDGPIGGPPGGPPDDPPGGPPDEPLSETERAQLRRLLAEREARTTEVGRRPPRRRGGWRAPVAVLLTVLGCVLAPVALVATWTHNELSDTDRYVQTVAPLAKDPAVQDAIAARVTTEIFTRLHIDRLSKQAVDGLVDATDLPASVEDRLRGLAGTMSSGLESFVQDKVTTLVRSPEFDRLWVQANRVAHQTMVKALSGESGAVTVEDDVVSLELGPIIEVVKKDLVEAGFTLAGDLPPINPTIEIAKGTDLVRAQAAYTLLDRLSLVLPFVSVGLIALGAFVARGHRRTILAAGLGVAVAMLGLGLGLAIGRTVYLDSVPSALPTDAAAAIFNTVVRYLQDELRTLLVLGLVVAVGAFLTGPSKTAVVVRSLPSRGLGWLRARAESAGLRTGPVGAWVWEHATLVRVLAVLLAGLVLVLWNRPTVGTVLLLAVLVLLVSAVVEFLARPPAHA